MTDTIPDLVIEELDEPCVDVTEPVEEPLDLGDEPYEELIILDLRASADDTRVN